jgi:tetratricopeptide (TPR) repeat protein
LPARESHFKEAPYPRSRKYEPPKKTPEEYVTGVEDKDPVWLKDKADHAYKQHDFHAAIAQYSKALDCDRDFLMARLNRVTCFMKMRSFVAAVEECDTILLALNNIDKKERESEKDFYEKMFARATIKRAASQAWVG